MTPSLNKELDWRALLTQLGVSTSATASPPLTTDCLFCRQRRLLILPDHWYGGFRYFCRRCFHTGDLLQLAGRVWNLKLPATIERLHDLEVMLRPTGKQAARYESLIRDRSRATEFWKTAKNRHQHDTVGAGVLIQRLGLRSQISPERYAAGPGRLLGMSSKDEAETFLGQLHGKTRRRLFTGKSWDRLVVIPFQDAPGRLCGFLFAGRGFDAADFVYAPLSLDELPEAGLSMHPEATLAAERAGNAYLAVSDPQLWLRLQFWKAEHSREQLPLVLWYSQYGDRLPCCETKYSWDRFSDATVTFWAKSLDAAVLSQASRCEGRISTMQPNNGELSHRLHRIAAESKPWRTMFVQHIEKCSDSDVEALLLESQRRDVDLSTVGEVPTIQSRLQQLLVKKDDVTRAVRLGRGVVLEQHGTWRFRSDGAADSQLVCDAILRIDQVVVPDVGETLYRGRLLYRDEELPFCVPKDTIDESALLWAWQLLVKQRRGLLQYDRSFARQAVFLATQFHQPELVSSIGLVGWDAQHRRLALPGIEIPEGAPARELDFTLSADDAPAHELRMPASQVTGDDVDAAAMPGAAGLWAAIAALLQAVLADVHDIHPFKVGFAGAPSRLAMAAAVDVLGDRQSPLDDVYRWPRYVTDPPRAMTAKRRLLSDRRLVLELTEEQLSVARLTGAWTTIEASRSVRMTPDARTAVRKIVTAYLIDLGRRRFQMNWHTGLATTILYDLQGFLRRRHVAITAVEDAIALVREPTSELIAESFGEILTDAIIDGRVTQSRAGFSQSSEDLLLDDEQLYVPFRTFLDKAITQTLLTVDQATLTWTLADAHALIGEQADGWTIHCQWWLRLFRRRRAQMTGGVRLRKS